MFKVMKNKIVTTLGSKNFVNLCLCGDDVACWENMASFVMKMMMDFTSGFHEQVKNGYLLLVFFFTRTLAF